jgi:hypothetical protein
MTLFTLKPLLEGAGLPVRIPRWAQKSPMVFQPEGIAYAGTSRTEFSTPRNPSLTQAWNTESTRLVDSLRTEMALAGGNMRLFANAHPADKMGLPLSPAFYGIGDKLNPDQIKESPLPIMWELHCQHAVDFSGKSGSLLHTLNTLMTILEYNTSTRPIRPLLRLTDGDDLYLRIALPSDLYKERDVPRYSEASLEPAYFRGLSPNFHYFMLTLSHFLNPRVPFLWPHAVPEGDFGFDNVLDQPACFATFHDAIHRDFFLSLSPNLQLGAHAFMFSAMLAYASDFDEDANPNSSLQSIRLLREGGINQSTRTLAGMVKSFLRNVIKNKASSLQVSDFQKAIEVIDVGIKIISALNRYSIFAYKDDFEELRSYQTMLGELIPRLAGKEPAVMRDLFLSEQGDG